MNRVKDWFLVMKWRRHIKGLQEETLRTYGDRDQLHRIADLLEGELHSRVTGGQ